MAVTMTNYADDNALMKAVKLYQPEAELALFKRFFRPLCLYADRLTGDLPAAEDIVSESFIKAFARRSEFLGTGNFKAFLYVATRNACINYQKANKKQSSLVEQLAYLYEGEDGLPDQPVLRNEIVFAELVQSIYEEVERLPRKCRKVFKMVFFDSLTTDVIAERLGINPQTVRTQKARALQLLKTELLKKYHFPVYSLLIAILSLGW